MSDRRTDLHELLNRFLNLVVEDSPVRDNDDGIEKLLLAPLYAD